MDVKDIMTRNPISIAPDAPVGTAIAVMIERRIRHLPVVDDDEAIVGIVTDRDLRSAVLAPAIEPFLSESARRRLRSLGAAFEDLRVKDVMTCNPITTKPEMAVSQAAALMLEKHVGSLLVVDGGKLVGILTDRDAVKTLAMHLPTLSYVAESLW